MSNYFHSLSNSCVNFELSQSSCTTKARYKELCSKKKIIRTTTITSVVLYEKCKLYDCGNSKITDPFTVMPSTCDDYGWIIKDGLFQIQWTLRKLVPDELFELISSSNRKSKCLGNQCVCSRSHGLPCKDLCNCDFCENQSEVSSDDLFDKNEDEITEDELEYKSSAYFALFEIT